MKKVAFALLSTVAASSAHVYAANAINPWQDCGIGAMVFEDSPTAAAISNIIWDLGSTAISSKVSSENSCVSREVKTALFIQSTFNNVLEETAKGEGEYVTAMLDMMDCRQEDFATIMSGVRADVSGQVHSYQGMSLSAKSESYYNALAANAATCGV